MQLKKINESHYVVVTDEPIGEMDFQLRLDTLKISLGVDTKEDGIVRKKIIASTQRVHDNDFWDIQKLNLYECRALVGEVDVEKKVNEYFERERKRDVNELERTQFSWHWEKHFINGYNQCLEDNKDKKFSEEDIMSAISYALHVWEYRRGPIRISDLKKETIDSLTQPKDSWEVEFDENNNLKLK